MEDSVSPCLSINQNKPGTSNSSRKPGAMCTCVSEITGFGPGPAGFGAVIAVGVVFVGEEHDPLVAHLDLDVTEEVGTDPQHFA